MASSHNRTGRPRREPPPSEEWYENASPKRLDPSDIRTVCANCGRVFYQPAESRFPAVQRLRYCSSACKVQAQNRAYYARHGETVKRRVMQRRKEVRHA